MTTALVIVACILLLIGSIKPASNGYVDLGWLGMFFFVLSFIWGKL